MLEYVKINDPDISQDKKMPLERFLSTMYQGTFRGFNLIFGNILDRIEKGHLTSGNLRVYSDQNQTLNLKKFVQPAILLP